MLCLFESTALSLAIVLCVAIYFLAAGIENILFSGTEEEQENGFSMFRPNCLTD